MEIQARNILGLKYVRAMCDPPSVKVLVESIKLFSK